MEKKRSEPFAKGQQLEPGEDTTLNCMHDIDDACLLNQQISQLHSNRP